MGGKGGAEFWEGEAGREQSPPAAETREAEGVVVAGFFLVGVGVGRREDEEDEEMS